jgi:hypothetical protein
VPAGIQPIQQWQGNIDYGKVWANFFDRFDEAASVRTYRRHVIFLLQNLDDAFGNKTMVVGHDDLRLHAIDSFLSYGG